MSNFDEERKLLTKTTSEYILKPKPIYKYIARVVLFTLITELSSVTLPDELKIDYTSIKAQYGIIPAILLAIFIGRYIGGFSVISISIKTGIIIICLYIDYKLHKKAEPGTKYSTMNFLFGFNNTINNYYK